MNFASFVHILNPNQKNRAGVKRFFEKRPELRGIWVERTSHPTHLETVVDWALTEGHRHIAIWGGDGSLNRMVQALHQKKVLKEITLGLVPAGTGNDFSRLIIRMDWQKWALQLLEHKAQPQHFDVGWLQNYDRVFLNNAGFGRTREALDRKRPDPIKDIQGFTEKKLQVEWGSDKVQHYETSRTILGMVFNGPYFNKGMYFDKTIKPDDGFLSAYFVPPQKPISLFARFLKSRLGGALKRSIDWRVDAEFIHVTSDSLLYPQVDGEVVSKEGTKEMRFSILKKGLKILTPN